MGLDAIRTSDASDTASSYSSSNQLRLILAFWAVSNMIRSWESSVVLPRRELALSLAGLGGISGRSCYVGLSPRKVPFPFISIRIVHIFLVKLRMLRYSCVIQRVVGKLTLISFPNNNEDYELELQGFGQILYNSTVQEKALELKPNFFSSWRLVLLVVKGRNCVKMWFV